MYFCWIDCETTGLDDMTDMLLEVAIVITDQNLNIVGIPLQQVIMPHAIGWKRFMDRGADDPVVQMHMRSGLIDQVKAFGQPLPDVIARANEYLAAYNQSWFKPDGEKPLWAGSGCDFDRRFLHQVGFDARGIIGHRSFEMQTMRYAFELWTPEIGVHEREDQPHRALDDLESQINQARRMRSVMRTKML